MIANHHTRKLWYVSSISKKLTLIFINQWLVINEPSYTPQKVIMYEGVEFP